MTLNTNRKSDSPFAPQVSPPRFLADSCANLCGVLAEADIQRVVVMSTAGAGDSWSNLPLISKAFMGWTNVKLALKDHNLLDEEIRRTNLDWTLVRASRLEYDGPIMHGKGEVKTLNAQGVGMGLTDYLSITSAAKFLVNVAVKGLFIGEAVVIRD